MTENSHSYENAITTERSAELLAKKHGFENLAQLAESLPQDAKVLDVGAGASPFGNEVAALRPDVTWVNFDYSYYDPAILEDVTKGAPENVEYVAGDATKLTEVYEPESFDAVYSYWLLPHLSLDTPGPAVETAKAMYDVTKPGGTLSVGPDVQHSKFHVIKSAPSLQIVKDESSGREDFSERIVAATTLTGKTRSAQMLANEVLTPFFGTTKYVKREKGKLTKIRDPEAGEYVSPLSKRGMNTIGRLAVVAARSAKRKNKS